MNERECSEAVTDWIGDELAIPAAARYAYPVAVKTGPLKHDQPDVAAIVVRKRIAMLPAEEFPWMQLAQHGPYMRVFDVDASVMLAVEQSEASALAVFQQLQGYGEKLEASALDDGTLGGRVPMISPAIEFDYSPVFAEDEGGTRGRLVVVSLIVGDEAEGEL